MDLHGNIPLNADTIRAACLIQRWCRCLAYYTGCLEGFGSEELHYNIEYLQPWNELECLPAPARFLLRPTYVSGLVY